MRFYFNEEQYNEWKKEFEERELNHDVDMLEKKLQLQILEDRWPKILMFGLIINIIVALGCLIYICYFKN